MSKKPVVLRNDSVGEALLYKTPNIAKAFAEDELEQYCVLQDRSYESDFDKFVESVSAIKRKTKQ
jgi:hypothetical protein